MDELLKGLIKLPTHRSVTHLSTLESDCAKLSEDEHVAFVFRLIDAEKRAVSAARGTAASCPRARRPKALAA